MYEYIKWEFYFPDILTNKEQIDMQRIKRAPVDETITESEDFDSDESSSGDDESSDFEFE